MMGRREMLAIAARRGTSSRTQAPSRGALRRLPPIKTQTQFVGEHFIISDLILTSVRSLKMQPSFSLRLAQRSLFKYPLPSKKARHHLLRRRRRVRIQLLLRHLHLRQRQRCGLVRRHGLLRYLGIARHRIRDPDIRVIRLRRGYDGQFGDQ